MGMPPATAASNNRSTPASSAVANSRLAGGQGGQDQLPGRLDAAHDLDHQIYVRVADDLAGVHRQHSVVEVDSAFAGEAADRDAGQVQPNAGPGGDLTSPVFE